jgi:uncharacterized protein (TIGR03435 family)
MTRAAIAAFACAAMAALASAQPADTFEVASVKPDPESPHTSFSIEPGGSLKIEGATLRHLIQYAFEFREFQVSGLSGWMTAERYTILAKGTLSDGPAGYSDMNDRQRTAVRALIRKRLQRLLAERFLLTTHTETRQLPIYALVVARNGHKLTPNLSPDGSIQSAVRTPSMLKGERSSLASIAQSLSEATGRPAHDETGLPGYYDFKMEWTPDAAPAPPGSELKPPENAGPTLFTALQEQLGLKLEAKKGPVEVLVIDHVERPSDN